jgi:hemolysin activation/secretion protein
MIRPARTVRGRAGVAAAALAASSSLFAQNAAPPPPPAPPTNAGRELEAAKPPPAPVKPDTDVLPQTEQPSRPPPSGTGTILVNGFKITGNSIFSDDALQAIVKPYVGQRLNADQLLDVADAIKDRYKQAGYFLTQVFVPPQSVPDGIVALRVVEARVGTVHADVVSRRVRESQVQGYMALLKPGEPVTEQDIERPLLLAKDLPGVQVSSVLKPGAELGSADLDVTVRDSGSAFHGDGYIDNQGNIATGLTRVGADLVANGLLGLGESWILGALMTGGGDTWDGGVELARAGVTAPIGPYGTKATATVTDLHYQVSGSGFQDLHADGWAYVASLLLQHPLERSRNVNLQLVGGFDVKYVNDRQQSGVDQDDRHLGVVNLGVTGDFRDGYLSGALNTYTAALYAGHDAIVTPTAARADRSASGHDTAGDFEHVNVDFRRLQSVSDFTSLLVAVRAQVAFQNLDESEKASLGGPYGVRAYAVGDGAGDDVVMGTVELRRGVPGWSLQGAPFIASAFIDVGHFKTWHDPNATDRDNARTLTGAGVGVAWTRRDDFQLRCDIAQKINRVSLQGSDRRDVHFWASLQKWF